MAKFDLAQMLLMPGTESAPGQYARSPAAHAARPDGFGKLAGLSSLASDRVTPNRLDTAAKAGKPRVPELEQQDASGQMAAPAEAADQQVTMDTEGHALPAMAADADGLVVLAQADVVGASESVSATSSAGAMGSSWPWGAIGLAGAAVAIGGYASRKDSETTPVTPAAAPVPVDTSLPAPMNSLRKVTFEQQGVTATVLENSEVSQPVYTAHTAEPGATDVIYSLSGADANAFRIDAATGVVTLVATADYETRPHYLFDVTATAPGGASASQSVSLNVVDVAEPPKPDDTSMPHLYKLTFEADGVLGSLTENGDISQAVYTAHATLVGAGSVSYSLSGADAGLLQIDAATGAVTLLAPADYETRQEYRFQVIATAPGGLSASQSILLGVLDVNEAPVAKAHYEVHVTQDAPDVYFTIPADMFLDPDTTAPNNVLHYYINGGRAPEWTQLADASFQIPWFLSFDAATGQFTGKMPTMPDHSSYSVTLFVGAADIAPPTYVERPVGGDWPGTYLERHLAGLSAQQALAFYMDDGTGAVIPA